VRRGRHHWAPLAAEYLGTGLLVFVGLSAVIAMAGAGAARAVPAPFVRRLLTGLLFGGTGAAIALGPVGRVSGAHLDPVLSWAFWLAGSLEAADAALYTVAQCAGAVTGAVFLPAVWGGRGAAVHYGATLPGPGWGPWTAVGGEAAATFALVGGILSFVGHPRLRPFTPALLPPLVGILVALEAPVSGTSMNPARSLGPAVVAGELGPLWIYILGPALGAAAAALATTRPERVHVAKLAHHGHDPHGRFHGPAAGSPAVVLRRRGRPR
jgi:aquaporin Z